MNRIAKSLVVLSLAALGAESLCGGRSAADLVSIVVVDDTKALDGVTLLSDLPGYAGQRVLNVYAQFDDPTDQGVGVVGSPGNPFQVHTLGGTGFVNSTEPTAGDVPPPPGAASFFLSLNYDSFFTIGLKQGVGAMIVAPGTPGPNSDPWRNNPAISMNMAWAAPPSIDGELTLQTVAGPTGRVLLMRLVVQSGEGIEGHFGLLYFSGGEGQEVGVTMATGLPGGCCLSDESCLANLSQEECAAINGVFLGSASICLPALSCGGACCLPPRQGKGDCAVLTEGNCAAMGGTFLGEGVPCPISVIVDVVHDGGQWTHEIVTLNLCPTAGQLPCVEGPAHIDPWITLEGSTSTNCENFGHPDACPIPAGFFGEGSDPFAGVVCFHGEALGTLTPEGFDEPIDFGDADTLVRRVDDPFDRCELPAADPRTVEIAMERLSLMSEQPVTVTFDGGQRQEAWMARVEVAGSAGQPGGTLTARKQHCNGGTFDSIIAVCPTFLFTRVSDGLELQLDYCDLCDGAGIVMTAEGVEWVHDVELGLGVLSPVCSDFNAGVQEGLKRTECDCNGNGIRDACDLESLTSRDCDGDGIPDECQGTLPCLADVTCDTTVNLLDLLVVFEGYGCTNPPQVCPGDADASGTVDVGDVVAVVLGWGPCP